MRIELHQKLDEAGSEELAAGVRRALDDLQVVVSDFAAMLGTVTRMIDSARSVTGGAFGEDEVDEAVAFLEWLRANHFVLLGTRDYEVTGQASPLLRAIPGTGLGILRDEQRLEDEQPCQGLASRVLSGDLITIGKTSRAGDGAPARAHGRHLAQEARARRQRDRPDPPGRPVHVAGLHGAGGAHAAAAPQAAPRSSRPRS